MDGVKEPEVPLPTIPAIDSVKFDDNLNYAVLAQSPNYTPASTGFYYGHFQRLSR